MMICMSLCACPSGQEKKNNLKFGVVENDFCAGEVGGFLMA